MNIHGNLALTKRPNIEKTSGVRQNFIFSNESLEYLECLEKKNFKIYPEEKKLEFFEGPRVFSPKIGRFLKKIFVII